MGLEREPLLPSLRIPQTVGIVVADEGNYEEGDGVKATLTPLALIIEMRVDGNEGELVIPVVALLEAISLHNKQHES